MMLSGCFYFFQDESTSDTGLLAANFPIIEGLQSNLGMIEKDISEMKPIIESQKIDYVIADTAGRLQTNKNLMEELKKIKLTHTSEEHWKLPMV